MSLFSSILRAGAHSGARMNSGALLPWHAFEEATERSLRMLRGVHIPVSLIAVHVSNGGAAEIPELVGEMLSQFGAVGELPDGSVALLYLGPRAPEADGDAALANHLFARVEGRLKERGWGAFCRSLELVAAHGWTDEVAGPADLLGALAQRQASRRPVIDGGRRRHWTR